MAEYLDGPRLSWHAGNMDHASVAPDAAALIAAMRQLQAALDRLDRKVADRLGLAGNDTRCLGMLMEGPLAPRAIAKGLGLTSGSVTALIDRLQSRGFVTRTPDPADRRGVLVAVTSLAAERFATAHAPFVEAGNKLAGRYGADQSAAAAKQVADLARLTDWAAARITQNGAG